MVAIPIINVFILIMDYALINYITLPRSAQTGENALSCAKKTLRNRQTLRFFVEKGVGVK